MGRAGLEEDLGGCAPDHDHPVAGVRRLEIADVLADGLGQVALARPGLDVGAVEPPHVVLVEDGRHGLDLLQLGRDRFDMGEPVEHAAFQRGVVGRVRDRIPGAEDQLVKAGQGHEVANERHPVLRPLAEANGAHLSERTDGLSETAPDQLDAGDDGRRHGAEPNRQDAQPPAAGSMWCLDVSTKSPASRRWPVSRPDISNRYIATICSHHLRRKGHLRRRSGESDSPMQLPRPPSRRQRTARQAAENATISSTGHPVAWSQRRGVGHGGPSRRGADVLDLRTPPVRELVGCIPSPRRHHRQYQAPTLAEHGSDQPPDSPAGATGAGARSNSTGPRQQVSRSMNTGPFFVPSTLPGCGSPCRSCSAGPRSMDRAPEALQRVADKRAVCVGERGREIAGAQGVARLRRLGR